MLAKCPLTKCLLTKCLLAKRPLAKCPLAICPDTPKNKCHKCTFPLLTFFR